MFSLGGSQISLLPGICLLKWAKYFLCGIFFKLKVNIMNISKSYSLYALKYRNQYTYCRHRSTPVSCLPAKWYFPNSGYWCRIPRAPPPKGCFSPSPGDGYGACHLMIRKTWPWTILGNVLGECQVYAPVCWGLFWGRAGIFRKRVGAL